MPITRRQQRGDVGLSARSVPGITAKRAAFDQCQSSETAPVRNDKPRRGEVYRGAKRAVQSLLVFVEGAPRGAGPIRPRTSPPGRRVVCTFA